VYEILPMQCDMCKMQFKIDDWEGMKKHAKMHNISCEYLYAVTLIDDKVVGFIEVHKTKGETE
jgi:hypothetical protein